jgi:hypothetical protein
MFRERDNLIGVLFLVLIGVLAVILLRAIATGERVTLDLPPGVGIALGIVFFALVFVGIGRSGMFGRWFGRGRGRQWPDPQTGGKSWWDRLRGR